jgi:hypothetical protein
LEVGLSPNAANEHGESVVHMTCRLGHTDCLKVLIEHGCSLQVADDTGRTPLHEACWSPGTNFEVVDILLEQDRRLLCIKDCRGALPLSFLKEDQWTGWTKFLMSRKNKFWPDRDMLLGLEADPPLSLVKANSNPIHNPKEPISLELAQMVAAGRMSPYEADLMKDDDSASETDDEFSVSEDGSINGDAYSLNADAYQDNTETSFDESEMEDVLGSFCCLGKRQTIAWSKYK